MSVKNLKIGVNVNTDLSPLSVGSRTTIVLERSPQVRYFHLILSKVRFKYAFFPYYLPVYPQGSGWTYVIDTGRKNSEGKGVGEVLLDLVTTFPKHHLESKDGIRQAVEEIGKKLDEVATFDED